MDSRSSVKSGSLPGSTASSTGTKRKRNTEAKFYAVRFGHKPGVYYTWSDCLEQVKGFKKAMFKSFPNLTDAERFVAGEDPSLSNSNNSPPSKFYAVKSGRIPGIYTDWASVQEQITGWQKPKHRSFSTRSEAQRFLDGDDQAPAAAPPAVDTHNTVPDMSGYFNANNPFGQPLDLNHTDPNGKQPAKRAKKAANGIKPAPKAPEPPIYNQLHFAAGTGPLPPGTMDGFDPNIIIDPQTGQIMYKTLEQRQAIKPAPTMTNPTDPIRIYTDGSSVRNGQIGAMAGVGVYFGPKDRRNVSEPLPGARQTNQRAELAAVTRALDIAPRNRNIMIISDSSYAINCCTSWYTNWRSNGWKNSSGKAVENRDLIEGILNKVEERWRMYRVGTEFEWVKGHSGNEGNKEADRLAVEGARGNEKMRLGVAAAQAASMSGMVGAGGHMMGPGGGGPVHGGGHGGLGHGPGGGMMGHGM